MEACSSCKGAGLKPESLACLIKGKNIHNSMPAKQLLNCLKKWQNGNFHGKEALIAKEILPTYYHAFAISGTSGAGYLELNRQGKTLSDGSRNASS